MSTPADPDTNYRDATPQEIQTCTWPVSGLEYHVDHHYYLGNYLDTTYFSDNLVDWTDAQNNPVSPDHILTRIDNLSRIDAFQFKTLSGTYRNKPVRWSRSRSLWTYNNHHPVTFRDEQLEQADRDDETITPRTPATPEPSALQRPLSSLHLPTPQTPGPSRTQQNPQDSSEDEDFQSPTARLVPQTQITQVTPAPPVPAPVVPPAPPAPLAPQVNPAMATTTLGTAPEPFDGTPEAAESFLSLLQNYYYLNQARFPDEGRRVSAALTHFKPGTSAGEWARDRADTALNANPINYGTWDAFIEAFKKHFVSDISPLESASIMHSYPQKNLPFNVWYQKWSIHATRAGVDERTKQFAFRKNLNPSLHNRLLGISPQPNTLEALVEKAREFDRVWNLYHSPTFSQDKRTPAPATTAEEAPHINLSSTHQLTQRGYISKEERRRRIQEKLCFYCGEPNHLAYECHQKLADDQETSPDDAPSIRTTAPETEETSEEFPLISTMRIVPPAPYEPSSPRAQSPLHDF